MSLDTCPGRGQLMLALANSSTAPGAGVNSGVGGAYTSLAELSQHLLPPGLPRHGPQDEGPIFTAVTQHVVSQVLFFIKVSQSINQSLLTVTLTMFTVICLIGPLHLGLKSTQ